MTSSIIAWLEAELHKLKSSAPVQAVEADVKDIGNAALTYIKTNGLQDLYGLALTAVAAAAPGASWTGLLAAIEAQAVADGKGLVQGATAVVAAQAQADLIAAGKLLPPASSAPAA